MKRFLIPLFMFVLLGAGCFSFGKDEEPAQAPTVSAIEQAFEDGSSSFGDAATSSDNILIEPKRWDVDQVFSRHLAFNPPAGHWVYLSETEHNYWLVPGSPPEPGSEDPAADILDSRVARMHAIQFHPESFPDWDRFRLTMAQFQCVEGDTEDDLVGCLDKPRNMISGKTVAGLPYEKFELQLVRKKDQASLGWRTFVLVRLGEANDNGVLITIEDEAKGVGPALELAKSMRVDVGE